MHRTLALLLLALWTALVLHASLWPAGFPEAGAVRAEFAWTRTRTDLVVNLLGYLPGGWLVARVAGWPRLPAALLGGFVGLMLSFTMESLQAALPGRVASYTDLLANTAGALAGALAARLALPDVFRDWLRPQALPRLLLLALAVLALDRLWPLSPTLDPGGLRAALRPLKAWWDGALPWRWDEALRHAALHGAGWLLLARGLAQPRVAWAGLLPLALVGMKPFCGRSVGMEEVGVALALAALSWPLLLRALTRGVLPGLALSLLALWCQAPTGIPVDAVARPGWPPFSALLGRADVGVGAVLGLLAPVVMAGAFLGKWLARGKAPAGLYVPAAGLAVFWVAGLRATAAGRALDPGLPLLATACALGVVLLARAAPAGAQHPGGGRRQAASGRR